MITLNHNVEKVAVYDLLVLRQREDGTLGCSRPCVECGKWIQVAKAIGFIIKVYHVNEIGQITLHNGVCCKYKAHEKIW
jgi:hypothetical protein